jgi:hypothetical protein
MRRRCFLVMTKASRVRRWRCDGDRDCCRNCRDMPAPRGVRLCMKLNGHTPRSARCTATATLHYAPLARRNQGMMLVRSAIRRNAAAVNSRRLSQAKKRYVTAVRSPHVHPWADPPSARACVAVGNLCLGGPGVQNKGERVSSSFLPPLPQVLHRRVGLYSCCHRLVATLQLRKRVIYRSPRRDMSRAVYWAACLEG